MIAQTEEIQLAHEGEEEEDDQVIETTDQTKKKKKKKKKKKTNTSSSPTTILQIFLYHCYPLPSNLSYLSHMNIYSSC